jgi:xylulokinase
VALDVTGTWETVVAVVPEPVLTEELATTGIWVDSHVARDVWTVIGATVSADQLEWFRREFGQEEKRRAEAEGKTDWDYLIQAAAASPPGAHGVMFLPHMSGCYYPVVDHRSRGAFVGLRNIVTKGDLLRAVYEGLDYQLLQMIDGFAAVGVNPQKIIATGGGTQNEFWMQNKADVLGRPVEAAQLDESAALGAALVAGIGVGLYMNEQEAFDKIYRPGRIYHPQPAMAAHYVKSFKVFEEIYSSLRNLHDQLGNLS